MVPSGVVLTGALLAISVILLGLVIQYRKLSKIIQIVRDCRQSAEWVQSENLELRSALRAEKAHVDQLQRKLFLVQAMIPAA
jgi:hypothetical protein